METSAKDGTNCIKAMRTILQSKFTLMTFAHHVAVHSTKKSQSGGFSLGSMLGGGGGGDEGEEEEDGEGCC